MRTSPAIARPRERLEPPPRVAFLELVRELLAREPGIERRLRRLA
jgi:hypothetical protein